jgi:hypothetical protein
MRHTVTDLPALQTRSPSKHQTGCEWHIAQLPNGTDGLTVTEVQSRAHISGLDRIIEGSRRAAVC